MVSFMAPPDDKRKHPRSNVHHYLERAFNALRVDMQRIHWTVMHATSSAEHRRALVKKSRKGRRGERVVDLNLACNEMLMALAAELHEANEAEIVFRRLLWYPVEIAAGARKAEDLEAVMDSLSSAPKQSNKKEET